MPDRVDHGVVLTGLSGFAGLLPPSKPRHHQNHGHPSNGGMGKQAAYQYPPIAQTHQQPPRRDRHTITPPPPSHQPPPGLWPQSLYGRCSLLSRPTPDEGDTTLMPKRLRVTEG